LPKFCVIVVCVFIKIFCLIKENVYFNIIKNYEMKGVVSVIALTILISPKLSLMGKSIM